jgi:hypothetical protein
VLLDLHSLLFAPAPPPAGVGRVTTGIRWRPPPFPPTPPPDARSACTLRLRVGIRVRSELIGDPAEELILLLTT